MHEEAPAEESQQTARLRNLCSYRSLQCVCGSQWPVPEPGSDLINLNEELARVTAVGNCPKYQMRGELFPIKAKQAWGSHPV